MRKRDIQSFTLRLCDLKEYEQMKAEKQATKSTEKQQTDRLPLITKGEGKTRQNIRERIGLPME